MTADSSRLTDPDEFFHSFAMRSTPLCSDSPPGLLEVPSASPSMVVRSVLIALREDPSSGPETARTGPNGPHAGAGSGVRGWKGKSELSRRG